jgi:hypothetical protein
MDAREHGNAIRNEKGITMDATTETTTIRTVVFLGTTDDVTTCDCCGKKNLKGTVALSINDGDAVFFGCTCAARTLGRSTKEVRVAARTADDLERTVRRMRENRASDRRCEMRDLILDKHAGRIRDWGGRPDTLAQITALGGGDHSKGYAALVELEKTYGLR